MMRKQYTQILTVFQITNSSLFSPTSMRTKPILLCLFTMTSCVQELPVHMPETPHLVVVTGLINPKNLISLNIANLKAFSDTLSAIPPKILEISIKEDGVLVDHPTGQGPQIYSSTYPKEGSTYELTVSIDAATVIASTAIPAKVLLSKADYRYSDVTSQNFDRLTEATIVWNDPAGMDNYYELQILDRNMKVLSFFQFDQIDDPVIQQESNLDYAPSSFVFSDKQFDGKSCTLSLRFADGGSPTRPDTAYVILRSVSKEYYHFKKSWHKHIFLQRTSIGWDGDLNFTNIYSLLFEGDPVPLFTNVKQGLGIFAGYTEDIRKFRFAEK